MSKILIAGMGNVLRQDDGFGVEVARKLALQQQQGRLALPAELVKVVEVGIGGIHLVHELFDGYDVLVVIDAMERGSQPGTTHVLEAEVPELASWPEEERRDFLADVHYTTPSRALILAKALGVLPPRVFIVGCQPVSVTELGIGLSDVVQTATEAALLTIAHLVADVHQQAGYHEATERLGRRP